MRNTRASKTLRLAAAFAALATLGAGASVAQAQRRNVDISQPFQGERPFTLDIHGGFTWWGVGFATGARFGIPLLDNGFIPSINNAVYLNFGADFYWVRWRYCDAAPNPGPNCHRHRWDYGPGLGLPVTLHWEFYFNENWSAFGEVGFQVYFSPWFLNGYGFADRMDWGYWFIGAVGGRFHINEHVALTLRVGTPYASFGVTFKF